ncbi:hypothetical protein H0H87_012486 [Tephrocybe sp. NHM501043]|nr:hypothetical protein H0H87_012486 [Tephrocybe sp. NHM501043]
MEPTTSAPKPSLKAWINNLSFAQKVKKDAEWKPDDDGPVFGVPLKESLKHASVQISTASTRGDLYVWGTVPVVVAKCGLYLKNNATEVSGTFRVNGSNKRTKELQAIFERSPEEPVIPYDLYHNFRDALARPNYIESDVIGIYQRLIKQMPRPNQHLLLYVLDLLSVFAHKSDKNLMTASNLAVIFRPGLISHPHHELSPQEFELSQNVLQFLIAHQDHFMLDIPPPPRGAVPSTKKSMEDVIGVPSSDEESSNVGPGGWKLVNQSKPPLSRRRTTSSKDDTAVTSDHEGPRSPLSTVPESPLSDRPNLREAMKRSRTLPTRRKGVDGEELPRVLRKQKRVSAALQTSAPREVHTSRP